MTKCYHNAHSARSNKTTPRLLELHLHPLRRSSSCNYSRPDPPASSASESNYSWYTQSVIEQHTEAQSIDFPTMLFLDPTILQLGQVDIPRSIHLVPSHGLDLLSDTEGIHRTAFRYFDSIHMCMPFISKKRFHDIHLRSTLQTQPDVVLLLLALKLITTPPSPRPRNPRTPLYHAVKHLCVDVESSSHFSILVLQAEILVALYEVLHAIYPAAFLTIGACARYAHALGIDVGNAMASKRVLTLIEVEERRRVWWAIVILDRWVHSIIAALNNNVS